MNIVQRHLRFWLISSRYSVIFPPNMREINSEFTTHDLIFVQVANGGRSSVSVGKLCETKAFGSTSIGVIYKAKGLDLACRSADSDDFFFS